MGDEVDALVHGWERDGVPAEQIAVLELSKRISRLEGLIEHALRGELAELGLTYAAFDVLVALRRGGEPYRLRPSELSRALFLTSGGTSNVLQRLLRAGYVERETDPGDGRSRWVRLTPEGLKVTGSAMRASVRAHDEVLGSVPVDTARVAADALRDVLTATRHRR
ncbi:MAG: MarR family transcriptional regulator [Streptosporangiales bacterium]|nr:MarR family transcriptional regulator [Streptosporangiales bacterium]